MAKVLLVDDEMTIVQMVGELLRSEGHQVVPFTQGALALETLPTVAPELVIANLGLDRTRSLAQGLLQKARALQPPALVIMITASGSMENALEAIRRGAYDYVIKPFTLNELKLRVQRALLYHAALSENVSLRKQLGSKAQFRDIIGASTTMQGILRLIERVADSDSTILVRGPSGSGKELIARAVHFNSRRRFAPFIPVSCSLVPENLLEVELFGQRKGAFGSNQSDEPGVLREADGGTIFLDNVGALSPALQSRLLKVLEDRQVQSPADHAPIYVDIRMLAATQEPLEPKLADGTFQRDLYRRLNEVSVVVPPLRERSEDIPLLIAHFLEGKVHPRNGKHLAIDRLAMDACATYHWPGDVRELEHALEHARILSQDNIIQIADLPRAVQQLRSSQESSPRPSGEAGNGYLQSVRAPLRPAYPESVADAVRGEMGDNYQDLVPLKKFLRDQEITYLHRTLAQVGGSKERAAEVLRISLATMYRKLSEPENASEPL